MPKEFWENQHKRMIVNNFSRILKMSKYFYLKLKTKLRKIKLKRLF